MKDEDSVQFHLHLHPIEFPCSSLSCVDATLAGNTFSFHIMRVMLNTICTWATYPVHCDYSVLPAQHFIFLGIFNSFLCPQLSSKLPLNCMSSVNMFRHVRFQFHLLEEVSSKVFWPFLLGMGLPLACCMTMASFKNPVGFLPAMDPLVPGSPSSSWVYPFILVEHILQ